MGDTAEKTGLPPINLHAASYNLADLERASKHAEGLATEKGREKAMSEIADKNAIEAPWLEGRDGPAVPEHHELKKIEDAQGNEVIAPVAIASKEAEADAAQAEKQAAVTATTAAARSPTAPRDASSDTAS